MRNQRIYKCNYIKRQSSEEPLYLCCCIMQLTIQVNRKTNPLAHSHQHALLNSPSLVKTDKESNPNGMNKFENGT